MNELSHGIGALFETWAIFGLIGALGFLLGFAMNHGSICTFIAATELVSQRRPARFLALAECAKIAYVVSRHTAHHAWRMASIGFGALLTLTLDRLRARSCLWVEGVALQA